MCRTLVFWLRVFQLGVKLIDKLYVQFLLCLPFLYQRFVLVCVCWHYHPATLFVHLVRLYVRQYVPMHSRSQILLAKFLIDGVRSVMQDQFDMDC